MPYGRLIFFLMNTLIGLNGCAGPATPFGSKDALLPPQFYPEYRAATDCHGLIRNSPACVALIGESDGFPDPRDQREFAVDIAFTPPRQVWHGLTEFRVDIYSDAPIMQEEFRVIYNGSDESSAFLEKAEVHRHPGGHRMTYVFDDLRLPSGFAHDIEIQFRPSPLHPFFSHPYSEPICSYSDPWAILSTDPFQPDRALLNLIASKAVARGLNPSLLSALIAQESRFQNDVVSWAKAIGLTQVTVQADLEIQHDYPEWPRHPAIAHSPVPVVKSLIQFGTINPETDWRLDPEKSIDGGISYLEYLEKYWKKEVNEAVLMQAGLVSEKDWLEVILASYNSGTARVKRHIELGEQDWLLVESLTAARRYVRKISSYCYHFSRGSGV